MAMQTTSQNPTAPTTPSAPTAPTAGTTPTTRTRFGYFAAPESPPLPDSANAVSGRGVALQSGQTGLEDAEELLSLFDPRSDRDESPRIASIGQRGSAEFAGEYLPPLVPPVTSTTPRPRRAPTGRAASFAVHGSSESTNIAPVPDGPVSPARTPRRQLRLTRRGRVAVVLAIAAVIAGVSALSGQPVSGGPAFAGGEVSGVEFIEVQVRDGDTLATIAHRVAPDQDAATVVAAIQAASGLSSAPEAALEPGTFVLVPAV